MNSDKYKVEKSQGTLNSLRSCFVSLISKPFLRLLKNLKATNQIWALNSAHEACECYIHGT